MQNRLKFLLVILITSVLGSCGSRKKVVYFQDSGNFETIVNSNSFTSKFKIDDLISIHVSTLNEEASQPFNLYRGSSEGGFKPEQVDYLVDNSGNIDFPVIGKVKVVGLSSEEVQKLLVQKLSPYLIDPIINIRLRNYSVTVIGEVNRPGTYNVEGERISILEAIGFANDLTIKGRRDNVLVIRDFDGVKVYHRIDLTKKSAMQSPVYYLTQNDVVYIEPNQSAATASSLDNRAGIYVQLASLIITSTILLITRN